MRGTRDLAPQHGSGEEEETPSKGQGCVSYCITTPGKIKEKPGDKILPLCDILRKRRVQQRD